MRGSTAKRIRQVVYDINALGLPRKLSYRKTKRLWLRTPATKRGDKMLARLYNAALGELARLEQRK